MTRPQHRIFGLRLVPRLIPPRFIHALAALCLLLGGCKSASGEDDNAPAADEAPELEFNVPFEYGGFEWVFVGVREKIEPAYEDDPAEYQYCLSFRATNRDEEARPPCRLSGTLLDSAGHQADQNTLHLGDKEGWRGDVIHPGVTVRGTRWVHGMDPLEGDLRILLEWQGASWGMMRDRDARCPKQKATLRVPNAVWKAAQEEATEAPNP